MKTGYSIVGLADVFKKVADAVLENEEVTTVEFSSDEFVDYDEVGEFVFDTLIDLKCDVNNQIEDGKYVIKIYA